MLKPRRAAVVVCVALVVCLALVPVLDVSAYALLTPVWFVFAFVLLDERRPAESVRRPQIRAHFSPASPRAPPA